LWPLAVSALMCIGIVALWTVRLAWRTPAIGDGENVASYGFDLTTCLVDRDFIAAGGFPKDGLPAMVDPRVFTRAEMEEFSRQMRRGHQGKYLVATDRVIGVEIGGEARAYPLKVISWHEVINDTLGGVPIVVTYSPLCDSVVVFDRRVGGETLMFGVSGLLYNSNLLMYDRREDPADESLWCQLDFRAVAGPAAEAGSTLTLVPALMTHWGDWQASQAATTILAPDMGRWKLYKRSYSPYFAHDELRFPVDPLPADGLALKTPVVALRAAGGPWQAFTYAEIAAVANADGVWTTAVDGSKVTLTYREDPPVVAPVLDGETPLDVVYALHFAWHAIGRP
jgi:hypothetical protein